MLLASLPRAPLARAFLVEVILFERPLNIQEKKVANKLIAIPRFDGTADLLRIDTTTGSGELISPDELNKDQIAFGMFEAETGMLERSFVALVATPDGPLLFLKGHAFRPDSTKTTIIIKDDVHLSHFLVSHDDELVFSVSYEPKFGSGLHPYSRTREDIDFYFWLSKNINNPKLYVVYTKSLPYLNKH